MATLIPKNTITVEQFIDSADVIPINYTSFILQDKVPGYISIAKSVYATMDDYIDEIKERSVMYEFNKDEYDRYNQRPKLLADYLYGNSQLDFILLRINDIYDPRDFSMRKVRLLSKRDMLDVVSKIYNTNKKFINEYNEKYNG